MATGFTSFSSGLVLVQVLLFRPCWFQVCGFRPYWFQVCAGCMFLVYVSSASGLA